MIEMVDKDNEIITIFLMFKKLEEVSMIIEHMEDIKIHSIKLLKMKITLLAKKNTETKVKRAKEIPK